MSPRAIAGPGRVERFAHKLKPFTAQLRDGMSHLNSQFNRLGEIWRDQKHQKFAQEFEQAVPEAQVRLCEADVAPARPSSSMPCCAQGPR